MKNVTVNGVDYTGVSQVQLPVTGGGTALFQDVDETATGGDVPAFLSEYQVQEFTPEADTNEDVHFDYDLSGVPDLIMVISDMDIEEAIEEGIRTMISMVAWLYNIDSAKTQPHIYAGSMIYVTTVAGAAAISPNASTPDGVSGPVNVTDSGFDICTVDLGGTRMFWRAGHKYKIITARVKRGD